MTDARLAGGEYAFHVVPVGHANDGTERREVYREDLVAYVPRHCPPARTRKGRAFGGMSTTPFSEAQ